MNNKNENGNGNQVAGTKLMKKENTKAIDRIRLILEKRCERMVDDVLSEAMLNNCNFRPEKIGAFDKDWKKVIIVADIQLADDKSVFPDKLAEEIRIKMLTSIGQCFEVCNYTAVTIGWEWNDDKTILRATYILTIQAEELFYVEREKLASDQPLFEPLLKHMTEYVMKNEEVYQIKSFKLDGRTSIDFFYYV